MNCRSVPVNSKVLREKALSFYLQLKSPTEEEKASDEKEFKVSQSWQNSFRNCFSFKNVQLDGESASADEETVKV
jgi:hypothetical protein